MTLSKCKYFFRDHFLKFMKDDDVNKLIELYFYIYKTAELKQTGIDEMFQIILLKNLLTKTMNIDKQV